MPDTVLPDPGPSSASNRVSGSITGDTQQCIGCDKILELDRFPLKVRGIKVPGERKKKCQGCEDTRHRRKSAQKVEANKENMNPTRHPHASSSSATRLDGEVTADHEFTGLDNIKFDDLMAYLAEQDGILKIAAKVDLCGASTLALEAIGGLEMRDVADRISMAVREALNYRFV